MTYYAINNLINQRKFDVARKYCLMIDDIFHLAVINFHEGKKEEAYTLFNKITFAHNGFYIYNAWMALYDEANGLIEEADRKFQFALHPANNYYWDEFIDKEEVYAMYGRFLVNQNRLADAKNIFEQTNAIRFHRGWKGYYGLALVAAKSGKIRYALDNLEIALKNYYPIPEPILEELLFNKIRKTKRFKLLMKKHFNLDL